MARAEEGNSFLLCRIGQRIGALALRDVRETMRPLPLEPLAGMPPFVLGIAIIRGSPTPVVCAGGLLGSSASSPSRFVSLKLGDRSAALAVDAVLDIRTVPAGMLAKVPPLLQEASADLVSALGILDARLLLVLEAARLVPDSVWSGIDVPGAPA
jgi:purine-binding chemotaxis protein CheW